MDKTRMDPRHGAACCSSKNEHDVKFNNRFHHLRFVVIVIGGLAMGFMMFLRLSITVSIVSMVNHTQLFINEHPNMTKDDLAQHFPYDYIETGEFDWSNEIQEKIITFYMITYTLFQFFTTKWIMRCGLRIGVSLSLAVCAMTNVLTPVMSYWDWKWITLLRLINGCAASGIVSGMINLIERWTPKSEHSKGVVIYQFTGNILAVVAPFLGGMLASIHWQWAYYVPGLTVLVFCLLWLVLISNGPDDSLFISQKELDLINEVCDRFDKDVKDTGEKRKISLDISYREIFKIKQFYGLAILWCLYCATSGGFIFLLPSYLNRVLKVPIEEIGALTTIAQIGSLFSMLWPNRLASLLMNSRLNLSLTAARRVVCLICIVIANTALLCLAYSHDYLIVLVCINRFFHMTHDTIFLATVMSQFGHYGLSGMVYSILNSLGCVNSTVFCVLVGKYLDYTGETLECWSWVFIAIAFMNTLYLVIYSTFCKSEQVEIRCLSTKVDDDTKI